MNYRSGESRCSVEQAGNYRCIQMRIIEYRERADPRRRRSLRSSGTTQERLQFVFDDFENVYISRGSSGSPGWRRCSRMCGLGAPGNPWKGKADPVVPALSFGVFFISVFRTTSLRYNSSSCGCRQVVRPKLPKLVFAGSSPVTRSMNLQSKLRLGFFIW